MNLRQFAIFLAMISIYTIELGKTP